MQSFLRGFAFILFVSFSVLLQPSCKNSKNEPQAVSAKDTLKTLVENQYQGIDQSPMDISYCPAEYPQNKMKGTVTSGPVARVIYSRPHKKGRIIFSDDPKSLCQYGKPWRLGANESTEIEFFKPVLIGGKNINAGRYIIYCIPHSDRWEIILNSNLDSWGLHIDRSKDVFTTELPAQQTTSIVEDFTMSFQDTPEGSELLMAWDNVKTLLPLTFSK
ncbi:MAG: DUF2911 domain-containing protein [Chitinophagaceae bacterium]|nr:MAG: DUF2911 domain-containing protein [Chitinophagaceae bacterium]